VNVTVDGQVDARGIERRRIVGSQHGDQAHCPGLALPLALPPKASAGWWLTKMLCGLARASTATSCIIFE
jgi:hypothetical protein